MKFWRRLWNYIVDFLLSEPGQTRRSSIALVKNTMLREVEGLRRIAALSQAQADAVERQLQAAIHRSEALEATAKTLVQQGQEDEARSALHLKLANDRLVESLRDRRAAAQKERLEDQAALKAREAEVQEQLERMKQMEALEALNSQRRELEEKRRQLGGDEIRHTLSQEEERIRAEACRLGALAGLQTDAQHIAARKVTEAADKNAVEEAMASLKQQIQG